jgi:hypothetical protein
MGSMSLSVQPISVSAPRIPNTTVVVARIS